MQNENWEKKFDKLYGDDFEGGFRDKIKSFISTLVKEARKEAVREVLEVIPDRGFRNFEVNKELKQYLSRKFNI